VGLVQQTLLPRAITLAGYGAFSRVLAFANFVNNVVVASSTQGVSRAVARARGRDDEALRATLRVHAPIALGLALAFAAAAPLIADFQGAPHIVLPLTTSAVVALCYGLYGPLIGFLNGRAQFGRQAALDVTFAILRTFGLLGVGYVFFLRGLPGELGSAVGFAMAAVCIVPLALRWTGLGKPTTTPPDGQLQATPQGEIPHARDYIAQLVPLATAQLFTNALMLVDMWFLGHFLSHGALASGLAGEAARKAADEWVGVYRACQLFSFLPYQLLFGVTQVLFPMLARARAEGDERAVARYVERGARLAAIIVGLLVAPVVVFPGSLLGFAYGANVAARGEDALRVLALGQTAFAMLGIATTVLASLGKERVSATITGSGAVLVAVACWVAVPNAGFGAPQLRATALAASTALGCALIAGGVAVRASSGAFVPLGTALRVGAALTLATLAGLKAPHLGKLAVIGGALAVVACYVAFLVATRELTGEDAALVRALIRRRG
jgi:stage V sporulation protein B